MAVNSTIDGSDVLVQLGKFVVDLVNDHFCCRLENFMLLLDIPLKSHILSLLSEGYQRNLLYESGPFAPSP